MIPQNFVSHTDFTMCRS